MIGRRIACPFADNGALIGETWPAPGTYWLWESGGGWFATTPNGHLAGLAKHSVAEHEDGTITVTPSIAVSQGSVQLYHGWLERGVWREA